MAQDINKIFKQIYNDYEKSVEIATNAAKNAFKEAYALSVEKAQSCMEQYYKNYTPTSYRRIGGKNHLLKAVKTIKPKHDVVNGTHIMSFSIIYVPSFLDGDYTSNSRYHQSGSTWKSVAQYQSFTQDNGVPESEWILNNYLYGIHPRYIGTPQTGIINASVQDSETTMSVMTEFFQKELPNVVHDMIYSKIRDSMIKLL